MEKLICEICHTYIGRFDPEKIHQPITGAMFSSPNPRREVPAPFAPNLDWETMLCPVCRRRPMIKPYRLMIAHPRCFETPTTAAEHFEIPEAAAQSAAQADDTAQHAAQPVAQDVDAAQANVGVAQAETTDNPVTCPTCGKEYTSAETLQRYHTPCPKLAQGNEGD